ncbi:putative RNA-binding Zn ribbon-like protein [Mumia flava]|uniref:Putative RNA-binding Zn ribbon-like protein n=2 Tax=Mumia flava TaxID=1348852 RepID=A0A2M9BF70_9ACTN|nr:putative RNA-binding Zn ribbon-like protein [Mumia flava]
MQAAVALVNAMEPPSDFDSVEALDRFFHEHGYTGRHDGTASELADVRALRGPLRALLTAERDEAVALTNALLAEHDALPQLVRHGDTDWHIHAIGDDAPLAARIAVETAMSMVDVIRADELSRLAVCADADCDGLVLDLSRNRSKRFCSVTCGNRNAVAAYRARRSG